MMKDLNLGLFSRYRGELMGVATLLIILCHMYPNGVKMPMFMRYVLANGGAGCDVFLFLSGFGICHSYHGNIVKGKNVWHWYCKRYLRIFLPCAIIMVPFYWYLAYPDSCDWMAILINASGFGFLFKAGTLWYVSCTLLLYLITPLLDKMLTGKNKWLYVAVLSVVCLAFGYPRFGGYEMLAPWQFCIQRFPDFFIGYAMTKEIMSGKLIGNLWLLIVAPSFFCIISFLSNHYLDTNFSYFWSQGLVLLTISVLVVHKLHSAKINTALRFLGVVSLESYATNVVILPHFMKASYLSCLYDSIIGSWALYGLITFCCLLFSYIISKMSILISKIIYTK